MPAQWISSRCPPGWRIRATLNYMPAISMPVWRIHPHSPYNFKLL
jgi:hypothetical protein